MSGEDAVIDVDEMVSAAAEWIRSLGSWPSDESGEAMTRRLAGAKVEGAAYYGVQAILLSFVTANDGEWPPISPRQFSSHMTADSRIAGIVARHARSVMVTELRQERRGD